MPFLPVQGLHGRGGEAMHLLDEEREARQPARRCDPLTTIHQPRPIDDGGAFVFGRFRVLLRRRELLSGGVPVQVGGRAFDLLLVLLDADGALVGKDELMSRVWPGRTVEEINLRAQISALRKALGEDRDLIRTESGRGYRFIGSVCTVGASLPRNQTAQSPHRPDQAIRPRWASWQLPHRCRALFSVKR
jgi:DNA-binding winged helix-turn-helix (wHTH) protein